MVFSEPNVTVTKKPSSMPESTTETGNSWRQFAPSYIIERVDSLLEHVIEKKQALNCAVKDKINEVFCVCERIVDHYIPDESCERTVGDESTGVISRMSNLSHEISNRLCSRVFPYLNTNDDDESEKTCVADDSSEKKAGKIRPFSDVIREPLTKVTHQCIDTVKPVVSPLLPFVTPAVSLAIILFSTFVHIWYMIFIEPIIFIYNHVSLYLKNHKESFTPNDLGEIPAIKQTTESVDRLKNEVICLFTDENGKITIEKFEELCKTKSVKYEQLLRENITGEKLQDLLDQTEDQVKAVVASGIAPVKEAGEKGKKYINELVSLFSDENGQFSIEKIRVMVGESSDELKKIIDRGVKKFNEGKESILQEASQKTTELKRVISTGADVTKVIILHLFSAGVGLVLFVPTTAFLLLFFFISYITDVNDIATYEVMRLRSDKEEETKIYKDICDCSVKVKETRDNSE